VLFSLISRFPADEACQLFRSRLPLRRHDITPCLLLPMISPDTLSRCYGCCRGVTPWADAAVTPIAAAECADVIILLFARRCYTVITAADILSLSPPLFERHFLMKRMLAALFICQIAIFTPAACAAQAIDSADILRCWLFRYCLHG